jgi:hypothetical protein
MPDQRTSQRRPHEPARPAGRTGRARLVSAAMAVLLSLAGLGSALAAGGGKPATRLVYVADTRFMEPGFVKWIAGIYNHSYWMYALLVVAVMSLMGLALGLTCDKLIGLLGIKLGKMDRHE